MSFSNKKSGILNIYKPKNMTSFDVVRDLRKILGEKKVGHCGTLDPQACGVLPVCFGRSTKIIDYIMEGTKEYVATLKLGEVTDTYDVEGKVIKTFEVNVTENEVRTAINSFKGDIKQVPPMYSALKVNGKKLYELARQGIEIERAARDVKIHDITIENIDIPYATFKVRCSKGTYIRSLCYDIGEKLQCGAVMTDLERTSTGRFTKENSINIKDLHKDNVEQYIVPVENAFLDYPKLIVNNKFEKLLLNGVAVKDRSFIDNIEDFKIHRIYNESNDLIAIGRKTEIGFKLIKILI
ncbi:tRNA pseudouridine(55) synthase TruB [Clostridium senegalense]|uniref:tRNA pseudouridine synthase B n=1 Tax=Clostridium senegalense TaxID=1465809 RepID=A0A6M0GXL8_9CLOT|nr:tRNA pseudouridine(55) synthase TruB [Clostridium senegalense]NEU03346.1 tRNA pseudouridine(55) synthase TruB [Clostridium senegalense]